MRKLKSIAIDIGRTTAYYILCVPIGTYLAMIAAMTIGYLPYSDEPGIGWYSPGELISLNAFLFLAGWLVLLIPYSVALFWAMMALIRFLEFVSVPGIVVRIVGSVGTALLSGYITLAMGWFYAISSFPVNVAIVFGGIMGATLLPRKGRSRSGDGRALDER